MSETAPVVVKVAIEDLNFFQSLGYKILNSSILFTDFSKELSYLQVVGVMLFSALCIFAAFQCLISYSFLPNRSNFETDYLKNIPLALVSILATVIADAIVNVILFIIFVQLHTIGLVMLLIIYMIVKFKYSVAEVKDREPSLFGICKTIMRYTESIITRNSQLKKLQLVYNQEKSKGDINTILENF